MDGEMLRTLLLEHDPNEIFETRLELEPSMAALAAERATDEERQKLGAQAVKLRALAERILAEGHPEAVIEEYMEEDRKFHLEIGRCAHNNVLFTVFSGVNLMMKETDWKAVKSRGLAVKGNVMAYAEEHEAILTAILKKDSRGTHREAKKHIKMLKKTLF